MNGECGISATYRAVGDVAGQQAHDLGGQAQIASPAFIVTTAADGFKEQGRHSQSALANQLHRSEGH
jgi:hypothetical protein